VPHLFLWHTIVCGPRKYPSGNKKWKRIKYIDDFLETQRSFHYKKMSNIRQPKTNKIIIYLLLTTDGRSVKIALPTLGH
jgi:hypothetical protein